MGRPKTGGGRPIAYRLADGTKVPGVTTIIGRYKDSGGLIRWAYNCGRDGIDMDAARDSAADAGSLVHHWIDQVIHGQERTTPEKYDQEAAAKALVGFGAFLQWRDQMKLEVLSTETPLVSEGLRYGGTYDAVALVAGKRVLLDWKGSNAIYPEYVVQLAAYRRLLLENGEDDVTSGYLLRVGKNWGDFHAHSWPLPVLDRAFRQFELYRESYDGEAMLKEVV